MEDKKSNKLFEIRFGNHLCCKIKVTKDGIEVIGAMNGWGDGVPLNDIVILPLNNTGQ
jgi:hypothetical protein